MMTSDIDQQTVMCKCGFVCSNPRISGSLDYFYSSNLYRELYENAEMLKFLWTR